MVILLQILIFNNYLCNYFILKYCRMRFLFYVVFYELKKNYFLVFENAIEMKGFN